MSKPLIAIVGRPNVGKSMLFNKIIGRRLSIVEDTPGVTRDRIYGESDWNGRKFRLVDTGGIEPNTDNQILAFMREQAQIAIDNANVIIFVTDIKTGMTAADQEVAGMLQRSKKPIVLAVNMFRSIPSLEKPGASVLDEFYWLNKHDPNYSLCRATVNRGQDAHTDGKFNLSQKGCMEIVKLFMTPDEDLYDKTIEDVFDDEVFSSTFWLYWRTMFAFENWHSALEMKLYFQRFIHHIAGLPDFSALKFTRYNQYESLILPMKKYLEEAGVDFQFGVEVTNVLFDIKGGKKVATAIECKVKGVEQGIVLAENDLVFVTNGSCTEGPLSTGRR